MPLHPASSLQTPLAEGSLYRAVEEERVSASWVKSKQQHEHAQHLHGVLQELLHLCNYSGGLKGIDSTVWRHRRWRSSCLDSTADGAARVGWDASATSTLRHRADSSRRAASRA